MPEKRLQRTRDAYKNQADGTFTETPLEDGVYELDPTLAKALWPEHPPKYVSIRSEVLTPIDMM